MLCQSHTPTLLDCLLLIPIFVAGTNFPPDLYDGHLFGKESYYEELEKQQKIEMDKLGKVSHDNDHFVLVIIKY